MSARWLLNYAHTLMGFRRLGAALDAADERARDGHVAAVYSIDALDLASLKSARWVYRATP